MVQAPAQKRAFKDTLLLFFMYLHTCAVKLLYKHNNTFVDVRYDCILECCDYLRPRAYGRITAECDIVHIHIYTVGTESIQTPLNFSLFVILQPFAKII